MKIKNRIDQAFNNSFGDLQMDLENIVQHLFGDRPSSHPTATTDCKPTGRSWVPRSDVSESDAGYTVELELPGLNADDVSVEIKEGVLEVSGESKRPELAEGEKPLRQERTVGQFRRSFEFSTTVDADKISATFTNGILKLDVPKSEKERARKININVAE